MSALRSREYYLKHREKELARAKAYYRKHHKKELARAKAHRLTHPNQRKEWYAKHKTEQIACRHKWYVEHRTELIAYQHKWRKDNPQKRKEIEKKYKQSDKGKFVCVNCSHKRRVQERKDSGITNQQWDELLRKYNFRCAYCGIQTNMTIDHVIPLSKGGKHSIENIVPACAECNNHKHTSLSWKPQIYKKVAG